MVQLPLINVPLAKDSLFVKLNSCPSVVWTCKVFSSLELNFAFVGVVVVVLLGGIFKLYLQFTEQYNAQPPRIFFHTIPFHPNGMPINCY